MHGVDENLDLTVFEKGTLDHITLARHVLSFVFESGASLAVEGKWLLLESSGQVIDEGGGHPVAEHGPIHLNRCLGARVARTGVNPPGSIELEFDNGMLLRVLDDNPQFESFHIEPGGIHV